MGSLFTLILSGMFAAMSYRGSMFNRPELFVAAVFGSISLQIAIGQYFIDVHWLVLALTGYSSGLGACFVFDRVKSMAPDAKP